MWSRRAAAALFLAAAKARARYTALAEADRAALLAFLGTL